MVGNSLVLDTPNGIVFDPNSQINLTLMTNIVFLESLVVFWLRVFYFNNPINDKLLIKFIGFASSIPWISTLLSETMTLIQWSLDGTFYLKTSGKAMGGAGYNDVLFQYGITNICLSLAFFLITYLIYRAISPRSHHLDVSQARSSP